MTEKQRFAEMAEAQIEYLKVGVKILRSETKKHDKHIYSEVQSDLSTAMKSLLYAIERIEMAKRNRKRLKDSMNIKLM